MPYKIIQYELSLHRFSNAGVEEEEKGREEEEAKAGNGWNMVKIFWKKCI